MENRKLEILAEKLNIEAKEIEVSKDGSDFYTENGTYTVLDEDEAYMAVKNENEDFIENCGIFSLDETVQYDIKDDFVNNEELEKYIFEYNMSYAKDIKSEKYEGYANRLVAECVEADIISESELTEDRGYDGDKNLAEELAEYMTDRTVKDYDGILTDYFKDNFGEETTTQILNENGLIDYDGIAQYLINKYGYESLAVYDGKADEISDFVVFRQSDCDERSQEFLTELENDEDLEY